MTDRAPDIRKTVAAFAARLRSQGLTYEADTIERQAKLPPEVDPLDRIDRKLRCMIWQLAATLTAVVAILVRLFIR
jgi:hypothetical protein